MFDRGLATNLNDHPTNGKQLKFNYQINKSKY